MVRHLLVLCCLCVSVLAGLACEGADKSTAEQEPATAAAPTPAQPAPSEAAPTVSEPAAEAPFDEAEARRQPSFRQFSAWLEAFNSGDRERYRTFLEDHYPSLLGHVSFSPEATLDGEMGFRELTGGFELRKLLDASADEVSGWLQERNSDQFAQFRLGVSPTRPRLILYLTLEAIARPSEFAIERLTEGEAIAGMEARLREDAAADRFSGAVLVAKDGQVLFSHAYGLADRERGIPNTLQTRFRIGR